MVFEQVQKGGQWTLLSLLSGETTAKWFVACVHKLICINAVHGASQEKLAE